MVIDAQVYHVFLGGDKAFMGVLHMSKEKPVIVLFFKFVRCGACLQRFTTLEQTILSG